LGRQIVSQFYDEKAADAASDEFDKVFAQRQLPTEIPEFVVAGEPTMLSRLLVECKLAETGGEAKRLIKQGGATIDGEKKTDPSEMIQPAEGMIIKAGKRKFAALKIG